MNRIFTKDFKVLKQFYKPTKYPIVLCHGLMGFDQIELPGGATVTYFNGIKAKLEQHGCRVLSMPVPPMATIQNRASQLNSTIADQTKISKTYGINIIAHSMGGLDARYLISKLDPQYEVKSLTTLCTPHHGTTLADLFKSVTKNLPPNLGAFYQLTTEHMSRFNEQVLNKPEIKYFSYGARIKSNYTSPFYLTNRLLQENEGDNDGMVSVTSSKWGQYLGTLDKVDHADVINLNMYKPKKVVNKDYSSEAMYLYIMDDLANHGY